MASDPADVLPELEDCDSDHLSRSSFASSRTSSVCFTEETVSEANESGEETESEDEVDICVIDESTLLEEDQSRSGIEVARKLDELCKYSPYKCLSEGMGYLKDCLFSCTI